MLSTTVIFPAGDKNLPAQPVASLDRQRTNWNAEKRVADALDQAQKAKQQGADKAKEAADAARKTGVGVALWAFIDLRRRASASARRLSADGSGMKRRYFSRRGAAKSKASGPACKRPGARCRRHHGFRLKEAPCYSKLHLGRTAIVIASGKRSNPGGTCRASTSWIASSLRSSQ